MDDSAQPLYDEQICEALHALAPGQHSHESLQTVGQTLMQNSAADDSTDKKPEWYLYSLPQV